MRAPGRMVQPPVAAGAAPFHPRPLNADPDLPFAAHLPLCALSQRDELTSGTSEFLTISPTRSLNFSKPCQRPRSRMQK